LQVLLTMTLATAGSLLLASHGSRRRGGIGWQTALALSGALAMSSTAIVVKLMSERLELEIRARQTRDGRAAVPGLGRGAAAGADPALGAPPEALAKAIALALVKAAVLIGCCSTAGQRIMRWWLTLVARRKSEELFVLNLLLITLGLAWLTELAGLSLALGAFIAGMLISETEYKHQVETDIRPVPRRAAGPVLHHHRHAARLAAGGGAGRSCCCCCCRWLFKLALVTVWRAVLGATSGVSLRTGLYLAQAGEFGFVLLTLAQERSLVPPWLANPILASMVLSMLATPFIIHVQQPHRDEAGGSEWLQQSLQMTSIARKTINTNKHVIICGYGRCGQNLARMLEREGIPYMALDLDPDRVRQAAAAGDSVVFGDAARLQALMAAGLARASAVVVTYLDVPGAMKVLANTRAHAPQVPVIVRTQDDHDLEKLQAAGATEVVPEAIEGSLMLASHALALVGVPMRRVIRVVQDQRDARYNLLRGYFHGADDDNADELDHERLGLNSGLRHCAAMHWAFAMKLRSPQMDCGSAGPAAAGVGAGAAATAGAASGAPGCGGAAAAALRDLAAAAADSGFGLAAAADATGAGAGSIVSTAGGSAGGCSGTTAAPGASVKAGGAMAGPAGAAGAATLACPLDLSVP
jgi:CPA2 family monovalent cation:H+ antiporter-2